MQKKSLRVPSKLKFVSLKSFGSTRRKKTGRPLKFTEPRFRRMLTLIREGHTNSAACRIEGIDYTTWRAHVRDNEARRAEVTEAERIRDEVWRDHALEMVKSAMPKNWVAAMTYLERRFPNQFALRTVNRNLNSTDQPIGDRIDEDQLRRYSELMTQFAKGERGETSGPNSCSFGPGKRPKTGCLKVDEVRLVGTNYLILDQLYDVIVTR